MALAGFSVNLITGYVVNRLPGQGLILAGLVGSVVRHNAVPCLNTSS